MRGCLRAQRRRRASRSRSACCSATPPTGCWTAASSPSRAPPPTGKRVAVVGAGPAGLACAHAPRPASATPSTIFEARAKSGGLNEYGIAAYKVAARLRPARSRLRPVDRRHRGPRTASELGRDVHAARTAPRLRRRLPRHAASPGVNALGLPARSWPGRDGRGRLHRAPCARPRTCPPAGRARRRRDRRRQHRDRHRGAGQAARGRGRDASSIAAAREQMGATGHEQEFAQINGVRIKHWAQPVRLVGDGRPGARRSSSSTRAR